MKNPSIQLHFCILPRTSHAENCNVFSFTEQEWMLMTEALRSWSWEYSALNTGASWCQSPQTDLNSVSAGEAGERGKRPRNCPQWSGVTTTEKLVVVSKGYHNREQLWSSLVNAEWLPSTGNCKEYRSDHTSPTRAKQRLNSDSWWPPATSSAEIRVPLTPLRISWSWLQTPRPQLRSGWSQRQPVASAQHRLTLKDVWNVQLRKLNTNRKCGGGGGGSGHDIYTSLSRRVSVESWKVLTDVLVHEDRQQNETRDVVEPREEAVGDAFCDGVRRLAGQLEEKRHSSHHGHRSYGLNEKWTSVFSSFWRFLMW